ncbi:TATA box-binding protein-associated factor RNA polymerase I subunit C-like [Centruroides vittatus]|uniref:TATA box-binding protein-associated factor RNA polymerase I subunit C-like n=1 Tax=Centruroides vittatus TaxID=120091 RepID=UPI00350F3D24
MPTSIYLISSKWLNMAENTLPALYPLWHTSTFSNHSCAFCVMDFSLIPDHGGTGVDVHFESGSSNRQNSCLLSVLKHENTKNFVSKKCALPFTPPNMLEELFDPCCEQLCQLHRREKQFYNSLFRTVHSKSKSSKKFYLNFEKQLSRFSIKQEEIVVPKSLYEMAEIMPEKLPVPKENWLYSGGCLNCVKCININDNMPLLIYPGGKHLNEVMITELSRNLDDDKFFNYSTKENIKVNNNICQIYSQAFSEKILCSVREKECCNFLSITSDCASIDSVFKIIDDKLAYCSLSPYIMGEYALCTQKGHLIIRNFDNDKTLWDSECNDNIKIQMERLDSWQGCYFGSHPRCTSYSNSTTVCLADIRSKHSKCLELFPIKSFFLLSKEEITFSRLNIHPSFHHYVATTNHLVLIDERFPKKPILIWNHLLDSSPMYCDIQKIDDSRIQLLLGSHLPQQICCFQVSSSNQIQPISDMSPWHLSTPKDIVKYLKFREKISEDTVLQRLSMPLIGTCSTMHDNGFVTFQLSSVGDIFYQDHFWNLKEKTEQQFDSSCVFTGPFEMSDIDWWIKEASLNEISNAKCDSSWEPFSVVDCSEQINDIIDNCISSKHCKFCRHIKSTTFSNEEICPSCNISTEDSKSIFASFDDKTVIKKLPSLCNKQFSFKCKIPPYEKMDSLSKDMYDVWFKETTVPIRNDVEADSNFNYNISCDDNSYNSNLLNESMINDDEMEDIIPPSQEIPTVGGERIKIRSQKVSFVAGF